MTADSEQQERLPVPLPPEPSALSEGLLGRLLRQRFFLVALVILIFLGILFSWDAWRQIKAPLESPTQVAAVPQEAMPPKPVKLKEAEPVKPAAPSKEAATAAHPAAPAHPAPAAPPAPPRPAVKGEAFTRALIKIMDDQVNQTWFGWRSNTIIFGKLGLTDNVNHVQLGVLEVARRTVVVLNEHMTRFATTEAYNPQVNEAMNFFMVSPDKYWFPSASGK